VDSVSRDFVDTGARFALVMSKFNPDIKIRHLVATWPEDAPRGSATRFCRRHGVSRAWFYKIRAAALDAGPIKAMETDSTKPKTSPSQVASGTVELVLFTRESLKQAGYDHGPLSVASKLRRQGYKAPSRATLARIFTRAGVVVPEPRKKPRSAYRRFVYPEPNGCWQIDSTEWLLANGRKVAIFQIVDDHSRLALASLVASGETSEAAIRVVKTAIERHGVPQKFLSDNGSALNPTRMGRTGALVEYLKSLGVQPITGKPYKPTTQGKNERFHRTLHLFLNKRPPAATMGLLQSHIDVFDRYYNTEREHQSLPPGTTPIEAWNATAKAEQPQPPAPEPTTASPRRSVRRTANLKGEATVVGTRFKLGKEYIGHEIHVLYDDETIMFFDSRGTEIITHQRPPRLTNYVGNNKPRGFMANQTPTKS
jgi:putative transposase